MLVTAYKLLTIFQIFSKYKAVEFFPYMFFILYITLRLEGAGMFHFKSIGIVIKDPYTIDLKEP